MKHIIENNNDYFTEFLQNISDVLMIQDCNAQNKLLMNEWSFQGLPLVLSRLRIPLQTPTVFGQKLYIPSTLISLLHTTKILVKGLTLFFSEVFTFFWEIIQMRKTEVQFIDMRAPSFRKFSINS